jgi:hypothetical protein
MKATFTQLAALLLLLGAGSAHSQTLNWASQTESSIVDSEGNALDNSFLFQLGTFEETFIPDETNVGQWFDNWRVFDTASYVYDPVNDWSNFSGTENVHDVANYTTRFEGLKGYIWIRNTENTEYFLASADSWTFPTFNPTCCSNGELPTTWSVTQIGTPIWGSDLDSHGGGNYVAEGPFDIQTHTVPETGASLLVLISCGMAVLRRRRPRAC